MRLQNPQAIEQDLRRRGRVSAVAVRVAERLGARRVADIDWASLLLAMICVMGFCMMGMTGLAAIGLEAVGKGLMVAGVLFVVWIMLARFAARWLVLDGKQLQEIGHIMHDNAYAAWSDIVAGWVLVRPLVISDYRALKQAEKAHEKWVEAQAAEKDHQEAQAYLMSSPVGAIVEQKRLERGTAPAHGQPKAPARL